MKGQSVVGWKLLALFGINVFVIQYRFINLECYTSLYIYKHLRTKSSTTFIILEKIPYLESSLNIQKGSGSKITKNKDVKSLWSRKIHK